MIAQNNMTEKILHPIDNTDFVINDLIDQKEKLQQTLKQCRDVFDMYYNIHKLKIDNYCNEHGIEHEGSFFGEENDKIWEGYKTIQEKCSRNRDLRDRCDRILEETK